MTKQFSQHEIDAGQAVYTPSLLNIYDIWVLGISNSFIWKCPSRIQLDFYNEHIQPEHLDVGVGTGFYLDKCQFPKGCNRLGLVDMNQNSLNKTASRINRYAPESFQANVLEPLTIQAQPFQSIAVNYLLHCLPGALPDKAVVFDHLKPLLVENGTVFGATLLGLGVERSRAARKLMSFYQGKGIFSNALDSLDDLHNVLGSHFSQYDIQIKGCCALFIARK